VPWNKIPKELVEKYVGKYQETYSKFNYSHALEMMATRDDMSELSYSKFRKELLFRQVCPTTNPGLCKLLLK
jgi:hypothetical protein